MYDVLKVVNWLRVRNYLELCLDDNAEELTQFKAMKLLYYIQGISLAYLKQRFFPQDIIAIADGPFIKKVYAKYRTKRVIVGTITDNDMADYEELLKDSDCATVLNAAYDTFGHRSTYDLLWNIQTESPWENTKLGKKITDDEMLNYFKTAIEVQ